MKRAIIGLASFQAREGGGAQLGLHLGELRLQVQGDVECLGCELHQGLQGRDHWLLRSLWHSEEALQAHLGLPHMQVLGQLMGSGLIRHMALRIEQSAVQSSAA